MKIKQLTRRKLLGNASAGVIAAFASGAIPACGNISKKASTLAVLGGEPVRKNKSWPRWPYWDEQVLNSAVKTIKSRIWCRIQSNSVTVSTFEKESNGRIKNQ